MEAIITVETWASRAFEELPVAWGEDSIVLSSEAFEPVPLRLRSDHLMLDVTRHEYAPGFEVDSIQWRAPKDTFGALGLVILASLFNQRDVEIELQGHDCGIDLLLISAQGLGDQVIANAQLQLLSFDYCPQQVARVPWDHASFVDPSTLPWFCVAAASEFDLIDIPSNRKVAAGFGTMAGALRLAQLFLDLSRPANQTTEVCLEVEGGNRGVAPLSCEARFWLPGGLAYDL